MRFKPVIVPSLKERKVIEIVTNDDVEGESFCEATLTNTSIF